MPRNPRCRRDPRWTVIEIATGETLGTFDSEADGALCLVFEKLPCHQVDVLCDGSLMSSYTPWHSPGPARRGPSRLHHRPAVRRQRTRRDVPLYDVWPVGPPPIRPAVDDGDGDSDGDDVVTHGFACAYPRVDYGCVASRPGNPVEPAARTRPFGRASLAPPLAHALWALAIEARDNARTDGGIPQRLAHFNAISAAEVAIVALGRCYRMVNALVEKHCPELRVPNSVAKTQKAVLEMRNAFEHIDERAEGKVGGGRVDADALTIFNQPEFVELSILRYRDHSLNFETDVIAALGTPMTKAST